MHNIHVASGPDIINDYLSIKLMKNHSNNLSECIH